MNKPSFTSAIACQYILYQEVNSQITVNVRFEGDVWLTQRQITELFHSSRQNISQALRCPFAKIIAN